MCLSVMWLVAIPSPATTTTARARAAATPRPNILVILTDDQRATGTMRVLPAVHRWFGRRGTTFSNAYATTPLCCPSRASIFTGRYAHNHGVQTNKPGAAAANLDQATTMQRYLHDAGYTTAIYGKYFNAWDLSMDPPWFDRWGIFSPNGPSGYFGSTWNVDGSSVLTDGYSTTFIDRQGVNFIDGAEADDARPWFLELATFAPHEPATPDAAYRNAPLPAFRVEPSMEEADRTDKPPYVQARDPVDPATVEFFRDKELRSLMSVNDLVAHAMAALKADGELGNTFVLFLSDNGSMWGAHGVMGKHMPYSPAIRIPFLARWPGHLAAGAIDPRTVANIDLAPSILAAAGVPQDPGLPMDGRSLFEAGARDRLLTEYWRLRNPPDVPSWASTVTATYQYVEYYADDGSISFREYYDMAADPWQLVNLLGDGVPGNDPATAPLHAQLAADRVCAGSSCP
jgi:arylsulfatase A-like enzyme